MGFQPIGFGNLADEQLIHLGRDVGMEHHRYAETAEKLADDKEQDTQSVILRADLRHDQQDQVEDIAVDHRRDKRKQVRKPKLPNRDRKHDQQNRLQRVFCHAEAEKCKTGDHGDHPMQDIRRSDHHTQPKVGALHKADAQRDPDDPDEIRNLCIKSFFPHNPSKKANEKPPAFDTETQKAV